MNEDEVIRYITETFAGVETSEAFGYTFFFYGADRVMPFATLADSDNEYDSVSKLDRPGVYRLNIGPGRDAYQALFGPPPSPPDPSGSVETGRDFTALDQIMPHPDYAAQSWVCVLSPSAATWPQVQQLLAEAYAIAVRKDAAREAHAQPPTD
jgi:hypothetical protein